MALKLNRSDRRKMGRRLRKTGISPEMAIELFERRLAQFAAQPLQEGTKVRLNYDEIVNAPGYDKKVKPYKAFVEENRDKVFTVAYDDKHTSGRMVVLAEDPSLQQWLWWSGDLIVVDESVEVTDAG